MNQLLQRGWRFVKGLFSHQSGGRFQSALVDEIPDDPDRLVLYGLGSSAPWAAAFLCPCGCRTLIQLSLLRDERPHWQLLLSPDGRPSLTPSVWRTEGCRSHFWLRRGDIVWCKSGRPLKSKLTRWLGF
jgi:hypothetical protein